MKAVRLLSVILILALLSCCFIACSEEDVDANIPDTTVYETKVSFQIKDGNGKTIYEAKDFEYKWINEPTILNIVKYYVKVEKGANVVVDGDTLTRVGGVKPKNNEYWAFMKGVDINVSEILNDKNAQNQFINGKISTYNVVDEKCPEFTLVIAKY